MTFPPVLASIRAQHSRPDLIDLDGRTEARPEGGDLAALFPLSGDLSQSGCEALGHQPQAVEGRGIICARCGRRLL